MASNDVGGQAVEATLRSPNDDSTSTSTTQPSMKEIIEQKRLKAVAELARRKALAAAAAAAASSSTAHPFADAAATVSPADMTLYVTPDVLANKIHALEHAHFAPTIEKLLC